MADRFYALSRVVFREMWGNGFDIYSIQALLHGLANEENQ